jgi:glycine/D-amino acid oxidase-like deaminating enzyme
MFSMDKLEIEEDAVRYGDIIAQKIVFCDGIAAAQNPLFSLLPFSANKGEALIIQCEELPRDHVYKRGMLLVPLPDDGMFWLGANYQWEFENDSPSEKFYKTASELLQHWIKKPFRIVAHNAAIRPATLERRPFVGFHPLHPSVGILNGMGTKGASLAPFFANQLVQKIVYDLPITPEADVKRFSRILSKQ